jgi:hypothetical protein
MFEKVCRMKIVERDKETPTIAAAAIILEMAKVFVRNSSLTEDDFFEKVARPIFRDAELAKRDPDEVAEEFLETLNTDSASHFALVCMFCSAAMRADRDDRQQLAWRYVVTASGLSAYLRAIFELRASHKTEFGQRGAEVRHAEDRAMKADAIAAYLDGNFASKDEAAAHIARNVVPMKFRTVRDWLKGVIKED